MKRSTRAMLLLGAFTGALYSQVGLGLTSQLARLTKKRNKNKQQQQEKQATTLEDCGGSLPKYIQLMVNYETFLSEVRCACFFMNLHYMYICVCMYYMLVHITHLHLQITYDRYRISTCQKYAATKPLSLTRPSCLLPAAAVQCSPEVCWVHGVRGPRRGPRLSAIGCLVRVGVAVGFGWRMILAIAAMVTEGQ